jgi:hypothetical protein
VYYFNGNYTNKNSSPYLLNVYKQQKISLNLTIEFSFLIVKIDSDGLRTNKYMTVESDLRYASTKTRPEGIKNPVVIDNNDDIDTIISKLSELI